MKARKAEKFFEEAYKYVELNDFQELKWARGLSAEKFSKMKSSQFLSLYIWVVYAAGFKTSIIDQIHPRLCSAFKDLKLASLAKTRSIKPVLKIFNNRRKAECVLAGAKAISLEGFRIFKKRIKEKGQDALTLLPGIGPITKDHLARNIGLASVAKNDVWISRLVDLFEFPSHEKLSQHLGDKYRESPGVVDVVLWRFCADNAWKEQGFRSLDSFAGSL
jgi:hypothetical protein